MKKLDLSYKLDKKISIAQMIPEWEEQRAVLLAYPHKWSDWNAKRGLLAEARKQYELIIRTILKYEPVVLLMYPNDEARWDIAREFSHDIKLKRLHLVTMEFNDTWIRDYGPISVRDRSGNLTLRNFVFNGWGKKFDATLDNGVNKKLLPLLEKIFGEVWGGTDKGKMVHKLTRHKLVLEGGAVDINSRGDVLFNAQSFLNENRNPKYRGDESAIIFRLRFLLGLKKTLRINNGALAGDDTDGHIDTLARFLDDDTIVYVGCDEPKNPNYAALKAMEEELKKLHKKKGGAYNLVRVPMPRISGGSEPLPASYVNFLFVNGALLVPTYGDSVNDELALNILREAVENIYGNTHEVVPIDCRTLIKWGGSLHCATMQLH